MSRGNFTRPGTVAVALAAALAGCGGSNAPAAPTPPAQAAAPPPPATTTAPPAPAPPQAPFALSLPIRLEDSRNNAFGLNPFGVHIGDHGIDGHPGWDFEYAVGAPVLAAAGGTIQSVLPSEGGTSFGIQITHAIDGRAAYRTIYGVGALAAGVTPGAAVVAGQTLGIVSSFTRTIGTITATYGFTHFQFDDFSRNEGLTNPNAVSPEPFLTAGAREAFDAIWRDAFYPQELVEPFVNNPRDVSFPMMRAWSLRDGGLAAGIEFTRAGPFENGFSYVMRDAPGAVVETGTVELEPLAKPASRIDFVPGGSPRRLGVYSITGGTLRLDYGAPGAPRPAALSAAATYTTTP